MNRDQVEQPVFEPGYRAELGVAERGRARDDGLEDRLDVGRRARDHAQDLAGRRLLGQGFVAFGSALVEFSLERGHGLPQIGRRLVEHCHSLASPNPPVPPA